MSKKKIVLPILMAGTLSLVGYFGYQGYLYVHSDNAQVDARTLMLSAKVGGYVTEVKADFGDLVKAGDLVAKLDDRDFKSNLDRATADRDSINVRLQDAQKSYRRMAALAEKGASTQAQLDAASAQLNELKARQAASNSQVSLAELNVAYAEIRAPFAGYIARRAVQPGQLIAPGSPLFGFVESGERWVTANLKETELEGLKIGAAVDVKVDGIPGRIFTGTIAQFSPVTGATFALIPPDNATGNFTKVVQRVPVKITLSSLSPDDDKLLRVGMSAEVKIHRR